MEKTQLVALVVRLFAIGLAVQALRYIPGAIAAWYRGDDNVSAYAWFVIASIYLLIAFALWKFPLTTARKIIPEITSDPTPNWNQNSVLSTGFIILGVYFFYNVLSDFSYWFLLFLGSLKYSDQFAPFTADQISSIATTFVELFVSLYLILNSHGLTKLILKLRGRS